jgi:hypothetical protein
MPEIPSANYRKTGVSDRAAKTHPPLSAFGVAISIKLRAN